MTPVPVTKGQAEILDAMGQKPMHLSAIMTGANVPYQRVVAYLGRLVTKGLVRRCGRGEYLKLQVPYAVTDINANNPWGCRWAIYRTDGPTVERNGEDIVMTTDGRISVLTPKEALALAGKLVSCAHPELNGVNDIGTEEDGHP